MSWKRSMITALAVCVVTLTGSAGCATRDAQGADAVSPSPVGKLLDDRDTEGRPYREVAEENAPEVGVEVTPDTDGGWGVRLTLRNFRFSPEVAPRRAEAGRGVAHLYVGDRLVARLRTPEYHLSAHVLPRGTHQVTARLYADDGTVWAVDGRPVERTADVTVSEPNPRTATGAVPEPGPKAVTDPEATTDPKAASDPNGVTDPNTATDPKAATGAVPEPDAGAGAVTERRRLRSASGAGPETADWGPDRRRTGGRGSPDRGGEAS